MRFAIIVSMFSSVSLWFYFWSSLIDSTFKFMSLFIFSICTMLRMSLRSVWSLAASSSSFLKLTRINLLVIPEWEKDLRNTTLEYNDLVRSGEIMKSSKSQSNKSKAELMRFTITVCPCFLLFSNDFTFILFWFTRLSSSCLFLFSSWVITFPVKFSYFIFYVSLLTLKSETLSHAPI